MNIFEPPKFAKIRKMGSIAGFALWPTSAICALDRVRLRAAAKYFYLPDVLLFKK